ncbi:MAG: DsbA family protein [bacterium JZ-2024 1]
MRKVTFLLGGFVCLFAISCQKRGNSASAVREDFTLPLKWDKPLKAEIFLDPVEEKSVEFYRTIWKELKEGKAKEIQRRYYFVIVKTDPNKEALSRAAIWGIYCAQKQGNEEAFLDAWFAEAHPPDFPLVDSVAKKAGVKLDEFRRCQKDESSFLQNMQEELLTVVEKEIRSVPTVLISGTLLEGLREKKEYEEVLDRLKSPPKGDEWILWELEEPECTLCGSEGMKVKLQATLKMSARVIQLSWREVTQSPTPPVLRIPALFSNSGFEKHPAATQLKREVFKPFGKYWEVLPITSGVWKIYGNQEKIPVRHALGKEDAPLTVYEFTNFHCPACRMFALQILPVIKREYIEPGKIRWEVIHFPLTGGEQDAINAAIASECAAEQNAFWSYHDILFINQQNLSRQDLLRYAGNVPQIKVESFTSCLNSKKPASFVENDIRLSQKLGVNATPTFLAGNYLFSNLPYFRLKQIFDEALVRRSKTSLQ